MSKQFGVGRLIEAKDLQEGDVYKPNTKVKIRFQVKDISVGDRVVIASDQGPFNYPPDRPVILVQRDGLPVPLGELQ